MGYRGACDKRADGAVVKLVHAPTTRSFLACWPDTALTEELAHYASKVRDHVGGRIIARENLHITLAFLGELSKEQISAITDCCMPLPESYALNMDRVGFWKNRGLVWVGSREPNPEFSQFVEDLRHRLRRIGFRIDKRSFIPHITLLRKVRRRPRIQLDRMEWVIRDYTLCASELSPEGSRYSVLKRWSTI